MFRGDNRKASRATFSPVPLLTPCGDTITRLRLKTRTRQFQSTNHIQESRCLVRIRVNEALSGREGNPATSQFSDEGVRHLRGERRSPSAVREVNDGTVLGDHTVHAVQVARDSPQLAQNPTCGEEYDDALRANLGDCFTHRRIQQIATSDCAVVVERYDRQLHVQLPMKSVSPDGIRCTNNVQALPQSLSQTVGGSRRHRWRWQ